MTDRESLRGEGFQGFVTVRELARGALAKIPDVPGVYVVLYESEWPPVFEAVSRGGHFKGKDPTVPVATLEQAWLSTSRIIYIGKAGKVGGRRGLRTRLREYMDFGAGKDVGHSGGRYIWQLQDSDGLVVCWRPVSDREPEQVESEMLSAFVEAHGRLPFANLKRGRELSI